MSVAQAAQAATVGEASCTRMDLEADPEVPAVPAPPTVQRAMSSCWSHALSVVIRVDLEARVAMVKGVTTVRAAMALVGQEVSVGFSVPVLRNWPALSTLLSVRISAALAGEAETLASPA